VSSYSAVSRDLVYAARLSRLIDGRCDWLALPVWRSFGRTTGCHHFGGRPIDIRSRVLVPLAIAGVLPHLLLAFAALDVALAIGAWVIFGRAT
jgi:hypothetical protein